MKIILDITDEEYEVLRDYGTSLKSEDGHELMAPLKRGAEQALHEWVAWKAAQKNRTESAVSGWKMQTECHTKKTGTGNLSVKVHGTGRTAVKADLEI